LPEAEFKFDCLEEKTKEYFFSIDNSVQIFSLSNKNGNLGAFFLSPFAFKTGDYISL